MIIFARVFKNIKFSIMECRAHKAEIQDTFTSVRDFSYNEKRSPFMDQERMNAFLDAILEFKIAVDEQKEVYEDLESVFFFLPEMPDFKETTKLLSLV
jgi:hypothetical protein